MAKETLVDVIRNNPGCVAVVDNDCWYLFRNDPEAMPDGLTVDEELRWEEDNRIADYRSHPMPGEGYGSGNCYGGDILQALAKIAGIKVTSV